MGTRTRGRFLRLLMLVMALSFVLPAQAVPPRIRPVMASPERTNPARWRTTATRTRSRTSSSRTTGRPSVSIAPACASSACRAAPSRSSGTTCAAGRGATTWVAFPAKTVLGKYVQADCGDRDGQWRADYMVSYSGNSGNLIEFWGELEAYLNTGGTVSYKVIAELYYNATLKAGTRAGTKVASSGASAFTYDQGQIATTGGRNSTPARTMTTCSKPRDEQGAGRIARPAPAPAVCDAALPGGGGRSPCHRLRPTDAPARRRRDDDDHRA